MMAPAWAGFVIFLATGFRAGFGWAARTGFLAGLAALVRREATFALRAAGRFVSDVLDFAAAAGFAAAAAAGFGVSVVAGFEAAATAAFGASAFAGAWVASAVTV